jgi:hypothetical protein
METPEVTIQDKIKRLQTIIQTPINKDKFDKKSKKDKDKYVKHHEMIVTKAKLDLDKLFIEKKANEDIAHARARARKYELTLKSKKDIINNEIQCKIPVMITSKIWFLWFIYKIFQLNLDIPTEIIHKIYHLAILDYETISKQAPITIVRMKHLRHSISYSQWHNYCIKVYGHLL